MRIVLQYFGGRGSSSGSRNGNKGRKRRSRGQQLRDKYGDRRPERKPAANEPLGKDSWFTKLNAGSLGKSVSEFQKHTNGLSYEIGGFLDKNGKSIHMVRGGSGAVNAFVGLDRTKLAGATMVHNHPNASIFSTPDLLMFASQNHLHGLSGLVATGGKVASSERRIFEKYNAYTVKQAYKSKKGRKMVSHIMRQFNKLEAPKGYEMKATSNFKAAEFINAIQRGYHTRGGSKFLTNWEAPHKWLSSPRVQKRYGFTYREL